jgi:hypothetical protein
VTIAVALKVNEGVILAADSAATFQTKDASGNPVFTNVYENANKVFNLAKGYPVGAVVWDAGSIGHASMESLAKDFRKRLAGDDKEYANWKITRDSYSVLEIAQRFNQFLYDEHYVPEYQSIQPGQKPTHGIFVAGYSSNGAHGEGYQILIDNQGMSTGPQSIFVPNEPGCFWAGQPEAIARLLRGFGTGLPIVLANTLNVQEPQLSQAVATLVQALQASMIIPAMPIQDAIEMADFFVDLTIKYTRFTMGAEGVGGPIELAAITRHEGFKWIRRKYYYRRELNPEG